MAANRFSRTANDFLRRNDFPGDCGGTVDNHSMRTARLDLAGARSPTVILAVPAFAAVTVARRDTNQRKTTFWSWALDYLIESLGLCGAAMHPGALFEPARGEENLSRPGDIHSSERREVTILNSPAAIQHAASPELDRRSDHVTPAGYVISLSDHGSRERERKIKTIIAALAELDDRTLLDMGVPHRSQIEQVVRYCLDC